MEMKPSLANVWQQVESHHIDFTLRQASSFQTATPSARDDVVYNDQRTIIHDKQVSRPTTTIPSQCPEKSMTITCAAN